jgi:hypothetical protein
VRNGLPNCEPRPDNPKGGGNDVRNCRPGARAVRGLAKNAIGPPSRSPPNRRNRLASEGGTIS